MKVSLHHLQQWIDINSETVSDTLTMLGHEVDGTLHYSSTFTHVVVGYVVDCQRHPNADKLSVCQVDINQDKPLQIVCGAANIRTGLKVPVAQVGAVLPGEFTIKQAKLRGEVSEGMICAASELGIDFPHGEGIWELSQDAPIGIDLSAYLPVDDIILDLALTPNRADCFSVLGLARDLAAKFETNLHDPFASMGDCAYPSLSRKIMIDPSLETRAVFSEFDVDFTDVKTPTPTSLILHRLGYTLISPICDAIHYVMHSLGQPMHAYDSHLLSSDDPIHIRRHHEENSIFSALDKKNYCLDQGDIIVEQQSGLMSLAGIIGGNTSKTSEKTGRVLLEAAYFPTSDVAKTSRRLKLSTDASMRFERGVDPLLCQHASNVVLWCLESWGIMLKDIRQLCSEEHFQQKNNTAILLSSSSFHKRIGYDLDSDTISSCLERLGCKVNHQGQMMQVSPPSWRFDLQYEVDLIEELARLHDYEKVPTRRLNVKALQKLPTKVDRLQEFLILLGFNEAKTSSLVAKDEHYIDDAISLSNPIAEPLSTLRSTLLPGLLASSDYNFVRGVDSCLLFEKGRVYRHGSKEIVSDEILAGVVYGTHPLSWSKASKAFDFYWLKGVVMHVLSMIIDTSQLRHQVLSHPSYHPGQSCQFDYQGAWVARLGKRHPKSLQGKKTSKESYLFEINLNSLPVTEAKPLVPVSIYPKIQRDVCFWLSKSIDFGLIHQEILNISPPSLKDITLFDIYNSDDDPDLVSYTLRLTFESNEVTLEEQDIQQLMDNILGLLQKKYNIIMR